MSAARILMHVLGAAVGGYAASVSAASLLAVALPRMTGFDRGEAVLLAAMLCFVFYLLVLLWAFSEQRLLRLWGVLSCCTALSQGLVFLLLPGKVA